jgi:hypothetical protein
VSAWAADVAGLPVATKTRLAMTVLSEGRGRVLAGGPAEGRERPAVLNTVISLRSVVMMGIGQGTVPVWRPGTALPI